MHTCRDSRLVPATQLPAYDFGPDHPFAADRQRPLFDLLRSSGLVDDGDELDVAPATPAELLTAHTTEYVELVAALDDGDPSPQLLQRAVRHGLGVGDNPIRPHQHEAARHVAGATLACARAVLEGRAPHAFNPAGGLHHALPNAASGFCIYNDLVVAIRDARARGAERVLYVDFDVHHGDGVELAFAADPSVMTISFHETPTVRWPFTGRPTDLGTGAGRGTAINVPLASGTTDASWLQMVHGLLPPLVRAFRPSLIVSQHGCDPHYSDPLADLELTTQAMHEAAQLTHALAHEVCDGRWVATGGGGYRPFSVIPRAWSMVWAELAGRALPPGIDREWVARWQPRAGREPLPTTWHDDLGSSPRHETAARANARTLERLRELLAEWW